jgi:hypothetical protein
VARKIERLLRTDPADCTRDQKFDCMAELDVVIARAQARRERFFASVHDPDDEKEWAREEVACELRWSPDYAKTRLMQATHLVEKLPRLLDLHEAGKVSDAHVRVAADLTSSLDATVIANVEEKVLERATEQTVAQFRASLRRAIARFDVRKAEERFVEAQAERHVECFPQPDGMAAIWSTQTAVDAEAMYARLTLLAKNLDDNRTMDQKRADTLRDLVLGRTQTGTPAHGARIQILVPQRTADGSSNAPGELAGYGPIPASQCRELLADPSTCIDRVTVDKTGHVAPEPSIDDHPEQRFPSAAQWRWVISEHPTCRFPSCNRRAVRCECDHIVPYNGHNTIISNLEPLCLRHHHCKHDAGWGVSRDANGVTWWISPTIRRRYAKPRDESPAADP